MKENLFPEITTKRKLNPNSKFYEFSQNNSGGSFDVDENVCHRVVIEAASEEEAIKKMEPLIENQSSSCPCCGDRWTLYADEINIDDINKAGYPVRIYTHYKDYEKRWFDLYGEFPRKEEPKLVKESWGTEFKSSLYFESVEQYCQFLANAYGSTTPDVRIFYEDGTKKEIFSKKI